MAALSDEDIKKELGKNIVIEDYSEESLTPVGYDLRIGAAYSPEVDVNAIIGDKNNVVIKSGKMLQIICKEFVWLSPSIMASIHSRGSLSTKGLILNSTTIDPNWGGQMAFALFNFSDKDIELKIGDRFATMVFYFCNTATMNMPDSRAIEGFKNGSFSIYEHSSDISQRKSMFEKNKQKAQTRLIYIMRNIREGLFSNINNNFKIHSILVILLFISFLSLILLPAGVYKLLQEEFQWEDYNFAYFLSNFAICISLLVAINKK